MPKINIQSVKDIEHLQQQLQKKESQIKTRVYICVTGCRALGALSVAEALRQKLTQFSMEKNVKVVETGCIGICAQAPVMVIEPYGFLYGGVTPEDIEEIITLTLKEGKAIDRLCLKENGKPTPAVRDILFYKKQKRLVLENCGRLDPRRIEDAIEKGAYVAAVDALHHKKPEEIIQEIMDSGLRGRGGAGFSAGQKWSLCLKTPGNEKYLICNADEGDPGAFMDRALLEGDPHRVIEGMIIAAYAIGCHKGFIYVRAEYPIAVDHVNIAIGQAREYGLLGKDIAGAGFSFDIVVRMGAGAFVCGEETALIASLEGKRGMPSPRPPYPAQKGYRGKPTNINNVETYANVPLIMKVGAKGYSEIGTEKNRGTKIFALAGKVNNTGLVEVPLGATLREIVFDIGGGIPNNKKFKAVQLGGPSGGCIPAQFLDYPLDYDHVEKIGAIMGSGGLIVMDDETCMVDMARYFINFCQTESCGKCTPCREGTKKLLEILENICNGKGQDEDLLTLETLGIYIKKASLCGLGQTAPNPVLSTLTNFREEYEEHIREKKCRAFVCSNLIGVACQTFCPLGTEVWRYVAYIARGEYEAAYRVIREVNPFPSVCARICHHPCEQHCRQSATGGQAISIRALKRFVTDRIDPGVFVPKPVSSDQAAKKKVAVIGAGPAGLTAAHYLGLRGFQVTIFEAEKEPGGMLFCTLPHFRIPWDVVKKEIDLILQDKNITLKTNKALGRDFTIEGLFADGFQDVLLAVGAHTSLKLQIEGEDAKGVYPSIEFLKSFNIKGKNLARGHVGIVGGGNAAVDAARVAIRHKGVKSVAIFYRRTRNEMPAYEEEIEAALEEGVKLETLVSPIKILTDEGGALKGLQFIRNQLGPWDKAGLRRNPVPLEGSEFEVKLNTLVVAVSEKPDIDTIQKTGRILLKIGRSGDLIVDPKTGATSRPHVYAAGDVVTGPNTFVEAIAAGKRAALAIAGEEVTAAAKIPGLFIPPLEILEDANQPKKRPEVCKIPAAERQANYQEVDLGLAVETALGEASRCLRCDLDFTKPREREP
jgi:NADH-quinone oxidoreductase subunit F